MALVLLLPPDAPPHDRDIFIRTAGWLADALAMVPCLGSPVRHGDREESTYSPVTDDSRWRH